MGDGNERGEMRLCIYTHPVMVLGGYFLHLFGNVNLALI